MNPSPSSPDPLPDAAAAWILKYDRGLTAREQDEFSQWLAASEDHRRAYAEARWSWDQFDRIAGLQSSLHAVPDPDLLAPRHTSAGPTRRRLVWTSLAAAAVVALGLTLFPARRTTPALAPRNAELNLSLIAQHTLPDGSVVQLNRGSAFTEHFSAQERRIHLQHGEAYFTVAKDPDRPFIVEARGVAVQAVGTVFNVRLDSTAVEVLVTEGRVQVNDATHGQSLLGPLRDGTPPLLHAGQSARVDLTPATVPQVTTVSTAQMEQQLAWTPRLLDFTDAALPEIVAAFNRGNPVQLSLADSRLHSLRLSATFRSDNVEGFVRLMESDFGLTAEWHPSGDISLRYAP